MLTIVALSPDLRLGQLLRVSDERALAEAVASGVLVVDGEHVRAAHPLIAAAAARDCPPAELRALHRLIAETGIDDELRIRHLALAATEPDTELAETVSSAASAAARRGVDLAGERGTEGRCAILMSLGSRRPDPL